jgi:hypothetical protein
VTSRKGAGADNLGDYVLHGALAQEMTFLTKASERGTAHSGGTCMETIATPVELVTAVAEFRFSPRLNARLQDLMERNTEGQLAPGEREELEALVELSETIALLRGEALKVLGRSLS